MLIQLPPAFERALRIFLMWTVGAGMLCIIAFCLFWYVGPLHLFVYVDVPLHVFGGLGAGTGVILLLYASSVRVPTFIRVLVVFGSVALISIGWELLELFSDTYLGTALQVSSAETLKDMVVSLSGVIPVAWFLAVPRFESQ